MRPRKLQSTNFEPSPTRDEEVHHKDEFDTIFGYETATSTDEASDSDVSEYGKRASSKQGKPKKKRKVKTNMLDGRKTCFPPRPASTPDMSDMSGDAISDEEWPGPNKSKRQAKHTVKTSEDSASYSPKIIQLHIDGNASQVINLDVGKLLHNKRTFDDADLSSTTLVDKDNGDKRPVSKRRQLLEAAKAKKLMASKTNNFARLPCEIREDIYRRVFVTDMAIDFTSRQGFPHSAAFLRTCRLVYEEGRKILYGENAFHFRRSHDRRGNYRSNLWPEIGFKDVRRFLEDIGPINISHLQYVSFDLSDAAPSGTPHLSENERRFVNDPVLHHIFELIGTHAHLLKFAFDCNPRKSVGRADYHFLRSLGAIRAQEVIYTMDCWASANKVPSSVIEKLKGVMTRAKEDEGEVDQSRKRKPLVKMHYELKKRSPYARGW